MISNEEAVEVMATVICDIDGILCEKEMSNGQILYILCYLIGRQIAERPISERPKLCRQVGEDIVRASSMIHEIVETA